MHVHKKPNLPTATLKLFPRLVSVRVAAIRVTSNAPASRDRSACVAAAAVSNDSTQLRARLLRMILDNEQSRRHTPRPNAG
jgi:hypothetical protein